MSLVKPRVMTPARWTANHRNARKSTAPLSLRSSLMFTSRWRWKTALILSESGDGVSSKPCASPSEA
jgi:hypothetical protein